MRKLRFPAEAVYVVALLLMAAGVAFVSRSSFGYSMIVAPPYLISHKVGLSFGTVEYLWQGALLVVMCLILRRFRISYLFSFVTAVLYGLTLDVFLKLFGGLETGAVGLRVLYFAVGSVCISLSVALFVRTYLCPEVYELFVKEFSRAYSLPLGRVKWAFDGVNLIISIVLSLCLFGGGVFAAFSFPALGRAVVSGYVIEGIGIGTLVATLLNGPLIGLIGRVLDRRCDFAPLFPRLAACFTSKEERVKES
jgi:uncharacterized membrane protein YczE